jgi:hypothetical protein
MYERCVWRYFTVICRHCGQSFKIATLGCYLTIDNVFSAGFREEAVFSEGEVDAKLHESSEQIPKEAFTRFCFAILKLRHFASFSR